MADPNDAQDRAFYRAEARPVIRALLDLPIQQLQQIRAIVTSASLDRPTKFSQLVALGASIDPEFLVDYAYWLPWDEIRPGRDPDEIPEYHAL